jgi:hypothetical protein
MEQLERLQAAMRRDGLDALALGGEAAGQFAAGHTRIGVHMPGWPIPVTLVPASGLPHVVTADPDGAADLPADHVHGMMWNPATLVSELASWLGGARGLRIGIDVMSPGGRALIAAAVPDSTIVDATRLLAEVMLVKSPDEIAGLEDLCRLATAAAQAGMDKGMLGLVEALRGAFPISQPQATPERASVAIRRGGYIAEARLGPGRPAIGERAVAALRAGAPAREVAAALPAGVDVVGIGRTYEAPVIRNGWATPDDLVLRSGAVLAVRWDGCGVTVVLGPDGPRLLSLSPADVAR